MAQTKPEREDRPKVTEEHEGLPGYLNDPLLDEDEQDGEPEGGKS